MKISDNNLLYIKFILVGMLNTAFGYCAFALLLFFGLHYALASVLSTVLSILFNFRTTGRLVFNSNDNKLFFKFILVYCFTCGISVLCLKVAKTHRVNLYLAGIFITILTAFIGFILMKNFVFKKEAV